MPTPQHPSAAYAPYPAPPGYGPPGHSGYPPQSPYGVGPPAFGIGVRVLVQWADGNRYPGIVQQMAPGQSLVVFPDGQQRWVDNQYLSPGG